MEDRGRGHVELQAALSAQLLLEVLSLHGTEASSTGWHCSPHPTPPFGAFT